MFRFKMHTKVLVAILLLGQLIELNVNLCIALSFERDQPSNRVKIFQRSTSWPAGVALESQDAMIDEFSNLAPSYFNSLLLSSDSLNSNHDYDDQEQTDEPASRRPPQARAPARRRGAISQLLESTGSYEYFGEIMAGTPAQKFYVLFDTSSSVFWLPAASCKSELCISRSKFNGSESSTYRVEAGNQSLRLSYDDDDIQVDARLVRDTVTIAGLEIKDQLFGEAQNLDGQALSRMPVDGIIGLGLGPGFAISNETACNDEGIKCLTQEEISQKFINPLASMQQQGLLKEPVYSLYLNNENENRRSYSSHNGELIFGEIVQDYFVGNMTYIPVTRPDFWEFELSRVSLKQRIYREPLETGCDSACPAIIDSGSAYIGGHFADVDRLNRQIGAAPQRDGLYRVMPCDLGMLPNLVFEIGSQEFELTPEEYVHQIKINGQVVDCISALKAIDSRRYPFWVLGEQFLRRHYVVFDFGRKQIGLAKSRYAESEEVDAKIRKNPYYFGRENREINQVQTETLSS